MSFTSGASPTKPGGGPPRGTPTAKSGQALVESCLVIALLCVVFFGVFQVSQLYMARDVADYAAARGARAKAVGFNRFMVFKTVRVGSIPNAGLMLRPGYSRGGGLAQYWAEQPTSNLWNRALRAQTPGSPQFDVERARIPHYLGAEYRGRLRQILDYEEWSGTNTITHTVWETPPLPMIQVAVRHDYPLRIPFHRAFYGADRMELRGTAKFGGHYAEYVTDEGW